MTSDSVQVENGKDEASPQYKAATQLPEVPHRGLVQRGRLCISATTYRNATPYSWEVLSYH